MPTEDAYSSGHLVLSHFGTFKCSNVETNVSLPCLVSGLLRFEHPSVLLFLLQKFVYLVQHTLTSLQYNFIHFLHIWQSFKYKKYSTTGAKLFWGVMHLHLRSVYKFLIKQVHMDESCFTVSYECTKLLYTYHLLFAYSVYYSNALWSNIFFNVQNVYMFKLTKLI